MCKSYLCKTLALNCTKLTLLTNWVNGRFRLNSIQAHDAGILQMANYGDFLATASADRTCKLYDISSGTCVRVYEGHEKAVLTVKMDSRKIITGSDDGTIRVWNLKTGEEMAKLDDHNGSVNSLTFYDKTLISGSSDMTIKIWKMEYYSNDKARKGMTTNLNAINSSMISNNLSQINSGSSNIQPLSSISNANSQNISNINNNISFKVVCIRTLYGHSASVQCVDTLPTLCVSGSSDGTLRLWHVER